MGHLIYQKMAIIGNGDIAKAIKDREGFIFLASGISNSKSVSLSDHLREREMIFQHQNNHIVYFSTLAIYYSNTEYVKHKRIIEECIKKQCNSYVILRIGNITWGNNPHTLINHLRKDQSRIEDTFRYLITKEELNHWIELLPAYWKHEMNITGEMVKVAEIVRRINQGTL